MNQAQMMKMARKMQADLEKRKAELASQEFTVKKQGVIVTIFGNRKISKIEIDEILLDPEDKDLLEDLMLIAINDAIELVDKKNAEISDVSGGMGI
ncbi:MAG: YbaB/EbfC family nucleoid-associated protein [Mollicutes bacterium PWAP]|nr:YbaB/EbfC family nucleoid-associated protein [Mollicutes bacterium PWAP]